MVVKLRIFFLMLLFILFIPFSISAASTVKSPVRVQHAPFPAKVAFLHKQHLWFMNGYQAGAQPVQLTKSGIASIIGWSPTGEWLAYMWEAKEEYHNVKELWIVNPTKKISRLVEREVGIIEAHQSTLPVWSPTDDAIAYMVSNSSQPSITTIDQIRSSIKIAAIKEDKPVITTVVSEKPDVADFTWYPDGKNLAVSYMTTKQRPMTVERVALDGTSSVLFSIGKAKEPKTEAIYPLAVVGMKWSPDGKHLAYFIRSNAASLSADANEIEVMNMGTKERTALGEGLKYAAWFAWSPDSTRLAYIEGTGRDAVNHKTLRIFDTKSGRIIQAGQKGKVDIEPVWTFEDSSRLLFTRGPVTELGDYKDRRTWQRTNDGREKSVTAAKVAVTDYHPIPLADGKGFMFLRSLLGKQPVGSLYAQSFSSSKPVEWIQGIDWDPAYYGSFLPPTFSVYQKGEK